MLEPGTRLGPYEILSQLGEGGMGEVYKGRDVRLERLVALKVLAPHLAGNSEARERFEREATTIANLKHAHICLLYDIGKHEGRDYLVLEYLEGETLSQRLAKGPLPLDQVLQYAVEIADALDKAHRAGVTHRDIKPGNIMVVASSETASKTETKLLDFGLAKLKQEAVPANLAELPRNEWPTGMGAPTAQGTVLGTAQYMAPEQVEGKVSEIDARTDIFSFGATVYEMVTGKKAFEGKSAASVAAKILEHDPPPMSTLQPVTPPALDHVVKKCLAKEPDDRWQTARDIWHELRWIAEAGGSRLAGTPLPARRNLRERLAWAVAAVLILTTIALGAAVVYLYRASGEVAAVRFLVPPPEKGTFDSGGSVAGFAFGVISPDGRRLAFTAKDTAGKILLWVRTLDTAEPQALPGTEDASLPFWSPDSRSIAFFAQGKLKRIDVSGGPPQTLCDAPAGRGGTWNRDGVILFAPGIRGPLFRVASAGGEPVAVTMATPQQGNHRVPSFLPDGSHFLYFAGGGAEDSGVFVGNLDASTSKRLLSADTGALYTAPGYLLFMRQGTLLRQPFDANKLELSGDPTPVAEQVATGIANMGAFSVSENGVLAYRTGLSSTGNVQLAWFDRAGKPVEAFGAPGGYRGVDVSPDGTRVAVHRHDGGGGDIWLFESARRGTMLRFTFDASQENAMPLWSPDGSRIAFGSLRNGKWGLYQKPANGTGREELLFESDLPQMPMSWSPDGKFLVYWVSDPKGGSDQWVLPLAGDRKPVPFLQSPFSEGHPRISPDGKWIVYSSSETGRSEIYVRPFPSGEGKWQISTNGGLFPRWGGDGEEIFYLGSAVLGKMVSVKVNPTGPTFEYGDPTELFDSGYINFTHGLNYHTFAVSPDGQRFLIPRPESTGAADAASTPITVVLNWTAGLRR